MTVNSNSQTEWRSTKEIQHFLCLVLMLRFSFATFQNGPPISANGPLRLANGGVHFGWRGPFGQMEGSVSKRTPPFTTKGPPISQNGPLHLAKRTPPFLKWTPPVQTNPSILRNVPLYFAQKGPLHFGKWTPSFCEMDPFILRNRGVHLKWRGPFRKMEGSIWRNGGVLFEMDPSILARLQLLPVRTVCKIFIRVQANVWYNLNHHTTRRNYSTTGESNFCPI